MSATFDPNIELPSTPIMIMTAVLVLVAFATVAFIVFGDSSAATAGQ